MNCSVEEYSLAVGNIVGHESIMSASRMNSAVVIFLDNIEKVNSVVQKGVVIQDTFTPVMPLVQPAKKIIVSNVPPFIKDEMLITELSRHGKIVSQLRKVPLGCKSPLLKHVVSFRRQVFMVLKSEMEELNVAFKFKIDGFDYVVFASSETMKCFKCGDEGHIRSSCPAQTEDVSADIVAAVGDVVTGAEHKQVEGTSASTVETGANEEGTGGSEMAKDSDETDKTADVRMEEDNAEYVSDDALFKTPSVKRKRNKGKIGNGKLKQLSVTQTDVESSATEDSDSDTLDSKNRRTTHNAYSFGKVKSFLQRTKNMKNVQVTDFFPDRRMFVDSVGTLMRSEGEEQFTVQEIYRLKKIAAKLRSELQVQDGFETT
ncbi:Transposon TX1 uncharacterized 82 kDa protein [Labeo rohita]|uniref:Transposon TX1 uncharacterized 82 kDa protein n=1 Tax=Labeo rohita TaxID=84645 RepID=A0ABQ8L4I9_LABRO|nr:Transposon TX1 uncharacterized 82 kDa protein [Labeo rohita]